MNCPKCGKEVKPGQKFCTSCGTKLQAVNSEQQNAPQTSNSQIPGQKGFIDNVRHLGTFIRQGSEGVDRLVRREQEQRVRQQAEALGMEVNRAPRGGQQSQSQSEGQQSTAQGNQGNQVNAPWGGQSSDNANNSQPQQSQQPQSRRLTVDNTSVEGVNIVSGRAIWDIHKGEIGRLITEAEFANAEGLKGVIVQEGCTGMVFIDGQFISMMQAGVYTFPAKTEAEIRLQQRQQELEAEEKELEKQRKAQEEAQRKQDQEYAQTFAARGVFGEVAAFGRGVMNFLFGKKKEETAQQHKTRVEKTQQKLRMIPSPKICRVYIVSNRIINLIFGSQELKDGTIDFAPMLIPTKLVDVNVGVSMQLEITNMQEFVKNYLADQKSVSILYFQQMLMPGVKATLTQMLRNLDYQQEGLPEPVVNNLKNRLLLTGNDRLYGIQVKRILDITDQSADFERFRSVERELFASEKELSYLQRTGEFRNRLEQEQNKQTIDRAQNAEELRRALQAINTDKYKDELLNKDELEQFVLLLESQQRIRRANLQKDEAVAMEEVRAALLDLKKCKLIKDDEFAALEVTLLRGRLEREDDTAALEAELLRRRMNREDDTAALEAELLRRRMNREDDTAALDNELEMRRMGRTDDVAALDNELEQRRIDRENVTQIMRIQATHKAAMTQQIAEFELSDNKLEHDMANELRKAQHQGNLAAVQLDNKRLLDAYNDERNEFDWNRAFTRRQQEDDYKFAQEQRRDDYDFAQEQRRDDYDWQKQQRQSDADWERQHRQEEYDWQKQQRQDESTWQRQQREQALREQQTQADYLRGRQDKMDDMDILERKAAIAQRNMQAMQDNEFRAQQANNQAELDKLKEQNRSAETIHSMDANVAMNRDNRQADVAMNRDNMEATMSAEALMAKNVGQMDASAQAAFANALGSGRENELLQKQQAEQKEMLQKQQEQQAAMYQEMLRNQQAQGTQNQEFMLKMAQMMQQGMLGSAGANMAGMQQQFNQQQAQQQQIHDMQQQFQQQRYEDQRQRAEEYRENAYHQQERIDQNTQQAMDFTTRSHQTDSQSFAQAMGGMPQNFQAAPQQGFASQQPVMPQSAPQQAVPQGKVCPACGAPVAEDASYCDECGQKLM